MAWKETTLRKARHSPRRDWQSTEINQATKACSSSSTSTGYLRHSPNEFLGWRSSLQAWRGQDQDPTIDGMGRSKLFQCGPHNIRLYQGSLGCTVPRHEHSFSLLADARRTQIQEQSMYSYQTYTIQTTKGTNAIATVKPLQLTSLQNS